MNKRIIILSFMLLLLLACSNIVSAYYLNIDAPAEVKVGEPIYVNGTTNVPPPDKIDIVFSHSMNVPIELARESIQITDKGDNSFNTTFETTGLEKGNYKIEGLSSSKRDFSAGSKSIRVVKIIDRSDLISFKSPLWQEFDKTLHIEAKITDYTDNAIQMEVKKGNTSVFGPESIPVTRGEVKYDLPIDKPGTYDVFFTDYDGFIGKYSIVSEEKDTYSSINDTEQPIEVATQAVTQKNSTVSTPESTPEPVETEKMKETDADSIKGISASANVSRENPGYFLITSNESYVAFKTSDNSDWVMEYKFSKDEAGVKVNDKIGDASEVVKIDEANPKIYVKVYPYSFKDVNNVIITAEGANAVKLSDDAADVFGAPPRYNGSGEEKPTPFPLFAIFSGLGLLSLFYAKRRG